MYPLFIGFALLLGPAASTIFAINVFAFLHVSIGFLGMYLPARGLAVRPPSALIGGIAFALGSFFGTRVWGQLNILDAMAWGPLAVAGLTWYWKSGKILWAAISGSATGLSMLAGHAEPALHVALIIVAGAMYLVVLGGEKRLSLARGGLFLAVWAASSAAVSAAQVIPLVEYQKLAARWGRQPDSRRSSSPPVDCLVGFRVLSGRSLVSFLTLLSLPCR